MTDQELMQQALEALEYAADETKPEGLHGCDCLICTTITALSDRLAQPEQEPLTDEHIIGLWQHTKEPDEHRIERFARAIEAAHGIKP